MRYHPPVPHTVYMYCILNTVSPFHSFTDSPFHRFTVSPLHRCTVVRVPFRHSFICRLSAKKRKTKIRIPIPFLRLLLGPPKQRRDSSFVLRKAAQNEKAGPFARLVRFSKGARASRSLRRTRRKGRGTSFPAQTQENVNFRSTCCISANIRWISIWFSLSWYPETSSTN